MIIKVPGAFECSESVVAPRALDRRGVDAASCAQALTCRGVDAVSLALARDHLGASAVSVCGFLARLTFTCIVRVVLWLRRVCAHAHGHSL